MLWRLMRWSSYVFIGSTLAFLVLSRTEGIPGFHVPEKTELVFAGMSVVTLPLALVRVLHEGDAKSRRNWALLFVLCIVVIVLAYVFHT